MSRHLQSYHFWSNILIKNCYIGIEIDNSKFPWSPYAFHLYEHCWVVDNQKHVDKNTWYIYILFSLLNLRYQKYAAPLWSHMNRIFYHRSHLFLPDTKGIWFIPWLPWMMYRHDPAHLHRNQYQSTTYPLANVYTNYYSWETWLVLWPFSLDMLNYQRVLISGFSY